MSAKTLTAVHCKAQGIEKAIRKAAVLGKEFQRALKVCSSSPESRVDVTAGHWIRNTPTKFTCLAYVTNLASVSLKAKPKIQVSAHSSSNSSKPVAHGFEFAFAAAKALTGTLTLTISGACSEGATDQYEILVIGDGWRKRFSSSSEKRFRKLVLKKVRIGEKGIKVQIRSLAVALLNDKGHCQVLGRASVRFDHIKK